GGACCGPGNRSRPARSLQHSGTQCLPEDCQGVHGVGLDSELQNQRLTDESARRRRASQVLQVAQRPEEFLIVVPAPERALEYLLTHLPEAGGDHLPLGAVEVEATLIPLQTNELHDLASPRLLVRDQL